ncbi:hypothetical protein CL89_gp207 [Aeromonas phage PX29]|uniref:Uncharacterized protein n=1 Tax=Aeromonas phage PX29 TaxID=926067 RepID=E5DQK4_9CAUD|nr:hypothetical protein CL89_gp207 [Aeromonas phage PX29]ADQ52990.1 conserved hypothetical protein [Aeromonas phage PX29]
MATLYRIKSMHPKQLEKFTDVKRHFELIKWTQENREFEFRLLDEKDGVYMTIASADGRKRLYASRGWISVKAVKQFTTKREVDTVLSVGKTYGFKDEASKNAYKIKCSENTDFVNIVGDEVFEIVNHNALGAVVEVLIGANKSKYSPKYPIILPSEVHLFKEVVRIDMDKAKRAIELYQRDFGAKVMDATMRRILAHYDSFEIERKKLQEELKTADQRIQQEEQHMNKISEQLEMSKRNMQMLVNGVNIIKNKLKQLGN